MLLKEKEEKYIETYITFSFRNNIWRIYNFQI